MPAASRPEDDACPDCLVPVKNFKLTKCDNKECKFEYLVPKSPPINWRRPCPACRHGKEVLVKCETCHEDIVWQRGTQRRYRQAPDKCSDCVIKAKIVHVKKVAEWRNTIQTPRAVTCPVCSFKYEMSGYTSPENDACPKCLIPLRNLREVVCEDPSCRRHFAAPKNGNTM